MSVERRDSRLEQRLGTERTENREQRTVLRHRGSEAQHTGVTRGGARRWYWKYQNCMVFIQSLFFDLDNANRDFFAISE